MNVGDPVYTISGKAVGLTLRGTAEGTGLAVQPQMRVGKPGAARPAGWLR